MLHTVHPKVRAIGWYREAAEKGHVDAEHGLGHCYEHGIVLPKDTTKAVEWYGKAAAHGHGEATEELQRLESEHALEEATAQRGDHQTIQSTAAHAR